MKSKKTFKRFIKTTLIHLFLVILAVFCLFFFFLLLVNATKSQTELMQDFSPIPGGHALENLDKVLNDGNIPVLYGVLNSIIVAGGSAFLSVYTSLFAAYGLFTYRFRFRTVFFDIIMMILVMPTQVCTVGFLRNITKLGLNNNLLALILPSMVSPMVIFFFYCYMKSVLPKSYIDAARVDGAGEIRIFNRIVLPMMRPALAVQAIFAFVASWNNYFLAALVMQSKRKMTLPVMIAMMRNADFVNMDMGKVYMMLCLAVFPVIIVYMLLSRQILDDAMQRINWN
jgi:multiple sugar transport system permease protein